MGNCDPSKLLYIFELLYIYIIACSDLLYTDDNSSTERSSCMYL